MKKIIGFIAVLLLFFSSCRQNTNKDKEAQKIFFNVSFSTNENGSIEAFMDGKPLTENKVEKDKIVKFIVKPNKDYSVASWEIKGGKKIKGGNRGEKELTMKVTGKISIKVMFKYQSFYVNFSSGYNGKLEASLDGKPFEVGEAKKDSIISFTAIPDKNYTIYSWEIKGGQKIEGGGEDDLSTKIKITEDVIVKVFFITLFDVSFSAGKNGAIEASINGKPIEQGMVGKDKIVTFKAKPNVNYAVDSWKIQGGEIIEGGNEGDEATKIKVTGDVNVKVSFIELFNISFSAEENGAIEASIDEKPFIQGKVKSGKIVTLTAKPSTNYAVDLWEIHGGELIEGGSEGTLITKIKITENVNVKVSFIQLFTVAFLAGNNGTLEASINGISFEQGVIKKDTTVTFTATPAENHIIDIWEIQGGVIIEGGNEGDVVTKIKITENVNVKVMFRDPRYMKVAFYKLDDYLKNTANETEVNYIEIIKLKERFLEHYMSLEKILSRIIKSNHTKKIAIKFGDDMTKIDYMTNAFKDCTNLIEVYAIPQGVKDMSGCFSGCTSLTQAPAIPQGVKNMSRCFYACTSLTQAPTIPQGVENMSGCFSGCTSLTQAPTILQGVKDMSGCFSGCTSLTQAPAIPQGVEDMRSCFENCTSLTNTKPFPSSVYDMHECFLGCINLTESPLMYDNNNRVRNMENCFKSCTSLSKILTIPQGAKNMSGCFYGCTSLTQVPAIPESVENMSGCFYGCTSLTQVPTIPESVENMSKCFSGCTSLIKPPDINNSYHSINMEECFRDCICLTSAPTLPRYVRNMRSCFSGCTSLTQAPAIPESVENMESCFQGCSSLTQVPNIPNGLESMENCFSGCTSLTQAPAIPKSVKNMESCFQGCFSLTQVPNIPNGLESMENCFYGCTSLTQAPAIPKSVENMSGCFYGCTSLTQAPAIPKNIENMSKCFSGCTSLIKPPDINNSYYSINMEECFRDCICLTSAPTIPEHVGNMRSCFKGCSSLKTIILKCSYDRIKEYIKDAFSNCTNLEDGGIKVFEEELEEYKNNAWKMGTTKEKFSAIDD